MTDLDPPLLPDARMPTFDPRESPLNPGGRPDPFERGSSAAEHLRGITDFPSMPHPRRGIYRVRREGWVARREAARHRFRDLHSKGAPGPGGSRILARLEARGGILDRARTAAVRPRLELLKRG